MSKPSNPVQLGIVGAPHGVKGELRVKSFTADPLAIGGYGPLFLGDGRALNILALRPQGDMLVARFDGVTTREQAAGLTNKALFVDRSLLPDTGDEEFYHADLVGLEARDLAGGLIGRVVGVQDFGAGDILEIRLADGAACLRRSARRRFRPST
ncbi:MAG: 16S rRNA processing protein RimM [Phyllobacteriaceae bacterium]|nr:16S rRNA processing protein RimM [Phyllobacteriaceae bacterium]